MKTIRIGDYVIIAYPNSLIFVDIWLVVFQDVQKDGDIRTTSTIPKEGYPSVLHLNDEMQNRRITSQQKV